MNILHQNNKIKDECNCRNKKYCSLGGKCLSSNIVYQGKVTSTQPNDNGKVYFGVGEYWEIKRNNFIPKLTWTIVRECQLYSLSKRKCYFCQNEKLEINPHKGNNLLNKRSELINKCRHLKKNKLLRHDSKR